MSGEVPEVAEAVEDVETHITQDKNEVNTIVAEARRLGHEVKVFTKTVEGQVEYELHFFHKDGKTIVEDEVKAELTPEEQAAKDAEEAAKAEADKVAADAKAAADLVANAAKSTTPKPGAKSASGSELL